MALLSFICHHLYFVNDKFVLYMIQCILFKMVFLYLFNLEFLSLYYVFVLQISISVFLSLFDLPFV